MFVRSRGSSTAVLACIALALVAGVAAAALPVAPPPKVTLQVAPVSETLGTPPEACGEAACAAGADVEMHVAWGGARVVVATPECDPGVEGRNDPGSCGADAPVVESSLPSIDPALGLGSAGDGSAADGQGAPAGPVPSAPAWSFAGVDATALGLGAAGLLALPLAHRLLFLLMAPFATRLSPDRLLDDGTRRRIYETIRDDPGVNLKALAVRLDIAWGTLLHHIRKLEDAHMIVSARYGKYRRYFLNGGAFSRDERAQLAALASPATARVAELILESPGATQRELGAMLGVSPSTVLWHAKRLSEVALVEAKREGRCVRYYPRAAVGAPQPVAAA